MHGGARYVRQERSLLHNHPQWSCCLCLGKNIFLDVLLMLSFHLNLLTHTHTSHSIHMLCCIFYMFLKCTRKLLKGYREILVLFIRISRYKGCKRLSMHSESDCFHSSVLSSSPAAVSELSPRPSNRPFFAVRADHFTSSHTLSTRTHTHTSLPPSALLGADR